MASSGSRAELGARCLENDEHYCSNELYRLYEMQFDRSWPGGNAPRIYFEFLL